MKDLNISDNVYNVLPSVTTFYNHTACRSTGGGQRGQVTKLCLLQKGGICVVICILQDIGVTVHISECLCLGLSYIKGSFLPDEPKHVFKISLLI